ncbi:MAG: hypothetical protein IJP30_01790 [Clostridia bacterium]|nr:hypothetical protein [Clostridia bacterium]
MKKERKKIRLLYKEPAPMLWNALHRGFLPLCEITASRSGDRRCVDLALRKGKLSCAGWGDCLADALADALVLHVMTNMSQRIFLSAAKYKADRLAIYAQKRAALAGYHGDNPIYIDYLSRRMADCLENGEGLNIDGFLLFRLREPVVDWALLVEDSVFELEDPTRPPASGMVNVTAQEDGTFLYNNEETKLTAEELITRLWIHPPEKIIIHGIKENSALPPLLLCLFEDRITVK